ncbi:MAG: protein kinase [Planctomycetes bacterium]|nr:protein kinase [Planctomycetota bacterium]
MTGLPEIPPRYVVREVLRSDDAEFLARADDSVLRREVILKAPGSALARHLASTGDLERCLAEARMLARIDHAHVVRLLDVVECPGGPLLVLEVIAGETLAARVASAGPLAEAEVVALGIKLASALGALHDAGAVHRAIEPDHVVLRSDGEPVLTGFHFAKFTVRGGIASSIEYATVTTSTTAHIPLPAPRYVAPEQRQGQVANARSDVYALGATLAFAWTGRDPPRDGDAASVLTNAKAPLTRVLARCLTRAPLQRTQTAAELRQQLERLAEPKVATLGNPSNARGVWVRRLVAAGLVAGALTTLRQFVFDDAAPADAGARGRAVTSGDDVPGYLPRYAASHALLIGIGDTYAKNGFAALKNAESDVAALRTKLEAMPWEGWRITTLVGADATKPAILDALAKLIETDPDDRVLIYFAGHGERDPKDDKSGFLVPADGKPRVAAHDENSWIASDELNGKVRRMRAKHVLLMLDCCYGGVMTRFRSGSESHVNELLLTQKAHVVIASGRPNDRVPDGEGERSPFLGAVLGALDGVGTTLTAAALFARVQEVSPVQGGSTPTFSHLEDGGSGDFVFFLKG